MFSNVTKTTEYDTDAKFFKITDVKINTRKDRLEYTLCGYATRKAANNNMIPIYTEVFTKTVAELAEPAKLRNFLASLEAMILALPTYTGGVVE